MCLALPARVETIHKERDMATVSLGDNDGEVKREVSLALVEDVEVGDYVLIHVGFALNKVSPEEARRTLQLFAEAGLT